MMQQAGGKWTGALLLLPSLTLLAGVGQAMVRPGSGWTASPLEMAGLAAAAIAPLVAALILSFVAPRFDVMLFCAIAMLAEIGAVTLVQLGAEARTDRAFYADIAVRQLLFIGAGFPVLVFGAWAARYLDRIRNYPYTLGTVALALTLVTVVIGQSVNGAKLWLQLGPLRFQPSEVARIFLAAFVAMYLYDKRHLVSDTWRAGRFAFPPAPYLIPLAGGILASVAILVAQNDLGMAALIALSVSAVVAGAMQSRSGSMLTIGMILLAGASAYALAPRVRARVTGWLEPWSVPLGSGYQFIQAEYVYAAGGVAGVARGEAISRVPEIHTDLVLVAIGGRFGLVGAIAVLALCAVMVLRCVIAALRDGSGASQYLALSLATLLGVQIILIVGGVLRVLPLTGLTLPLVSYGGTSMLVTFFGLGLILGVGASGTTQRTRNSEMA